MKYFVTGVTGQLGFDLVKELKKRGITDILAPTSEELDITDKLKVDEMIKKYQPNVIFHCAAYTAVDKAESDKETCFKVNVNGTENIAESANEIGAKMVYISTDYVFDGTKDGIYQENDKTNPVNYYGYTKFMGEEAVRKLDNHLIVRISWVFGINGKNFINTMLNLAETRDEISVVSDQIGSPTYTEDLAKLLVDMIEKNITGTFNATNENYCSWYEFAKYIFEINNKNIKVNPILTKDYKTAAVRPLNSKLNKDKLVEYGLEKMPTWQDATERYCKVLKKEN